ncbi:MAG: glutamate 5-kinase [Zetaproteobacteria bacterium]|nr:MAG: glutamate 5-kinase [Zetaproteobacteria bacterium]
MIRERRDLAKARRIVVKIGSSLLADARQGIRQDVIDTLVDELETLMRRGIEVAVVSSGAVALGCVRLGWLGRTLSVHEKQAAAAIGQPKLMRAYGNAFARHGRIVAQMLLTKDDLRHRRRYLNASNTSATLFSAGVVPIVNENDTVVVEEIKFGDNDTLGALVSLVIDADLLVMLTDVDGLYDKAPREHGDARRYGVVRQFSAEVLRAAGGAGSSFGTGGMASKMNAARISTRGGVPAAIVNGQRPGVLRALLAGEDIGTLFLCGSDRRSRRQHWIADVLRPEGRLRVDAGAERALLERGSSLLPVGVTAVEGVFDKGACIDIVGRHGVIARGLSNYSAEDLRKIQGHGSHEIERILGYRDFSSVIHRDNLVLLHPETGEER